MDTVKTRKQGNAVMVTLASKYGVPAGKVYYKKNEFIDEEDELATNFSVESGSFDE